MCCAGAGDSLRDAADILGQAAGSLSGGAGSLADAIEEMRRIVRALADKPSIQLTPLDDGITEKGDVLNEALSGLMDEADRLNSVMDSASESLLDNLRAISAQMGNVTDALRQAVEAGQESSSEDYFEDVSDQNSRQNSDAGTISSSQNTGIVEGDVNVAGIVGSMAVEYDFDPEDDLTERGSRSADFRFQARAVVRSCINAGKVTARKDYVGGITGRMDLGRELWSCDKHRRGLRRRRGRSVPGGNSGLLGEVYPVRPGLCRRCGRPGGDFDRLPRIGGTGGGTGVSRHHRRRCERERNSGGKLLYTPDTGRDRRCQLCGKCGARHF
mgnify:CR=1 FL=1